MRIALTSCEDCKNICPLDAPAVSRQQRLPELGTRVALGEDHRDGDDVTEELYGGFHRCQPFASMKHRSLIPDGPYIHSNEEKHGPAPVLVRPSLDVEDVAHGAELCEADGERNGDGGDPFE